MSYFSGLTMSILLGSLAATTGPEPKNQARLPTRATIELSIHTHFLAIRDILGQRPGPLAMPQEKILSTEELGKITRQATRLRVIVDNLQNETSRARQTISAAEELFGRIESQCVEEAQASARRGARDVARMFASLADTFRAQESAYRTLRERLSTIMDPVIAQQGALTELETLRPKHPDQAITFFRDLLESNGRRPPTNSERDAVRVLVLRLNATLRDLDFLALDVWEILEPLPRTRHPQK